jgi:hypothetical protein
LSKVPPGSQRLMSSGSGPMMLSGSTFGPFTLWPEPYVRCEAE